MEFGGYRRRLASEKFHRERDAEMYAVPYESWKHYKTTHPDYFHREHAFTLQELDNERLRRTLRVNGQNYNFILWRGSVCNLAVDAIVNAANGSLLGGGGVDGAIHDAAGYLITRECADKYTEVDTCGTVITKGYNLPADFVIHTVGPVYYHEQRKAQEKLALCYNRCFELCEQHHLSSIGLCCVSCGIYGYPPENASYVAINEALNWCRSGKSYPRTFVYVTFNARETAAYQAAFKELVMAAPGDLAPLPEPIREVESDDKQPVMERGYSTPASVVHQRSLDDEKPEETHSTPASVIHVSSHEDEKPEEAYSTPASVVHQSSPGDEKPEETHSTPASVVHVSSHEDEKPEETKIAPQSKVSVEESQNNTWSAVPIAEWKEFKRQHADYFRPSESQEIVGLERLLCSFKVSESDREYNFYIAKIDPLQLKVDAVITGKNEALMKAGGRLLEQDFNALEGKSVRPLKGYQLHIDYVVVGVVEAAEEPETLNNCYRDCLSACDDLPIESLAISALSTDDSAPIFSIEEVMKWIKRAETKVRTVVFAVTSEEQATQYFGGLQSAFELPKAE